MRFKKYIFVLTFITGMAATFFLYHFSQQQFSFDNITLGQEVIKQNPQYTFSKPQPIDPSVEAALNQAYSYLDRGRQSFAFISADGQYVIKFFDTSCMDDQHLLCLKKLNQLVTGYKIAFEYDRQQTGILYMQLWGNDQFKGRSLVIHDRFGFKQTIPLDTTAFVLQKKAIPTRHVISNLLDKGDIEAAKKRYKAIIELYVTDYKRGLYDRDHNFMYNTGFIGESPIRIDAGRLRLDERYKEPAFYQKDLKKISKRASGWLGRHYPQYREELSQYINQLIEAPH